MVNITQIDNCMSYTWLDKKFFWVQNHMKITIFIYLVLIIIALYWDYKIIKNKKVIKNGKI